MTALDTLAFILKSHGDLLGACKMLIEMHDHRKLTLPLADQRSRWELARYATEQAESALAVAKLPSP